MKHALDLSNKFAKCSGLKINTDKTEVIPLYIDVSKYNSLGVIWKPGNFKMLGVWFSPDEQEMSRLNLNEKIEKMKQIMNIWTGRNLTIFGRVMILKTMILSQIINICSAVYVSNSFIQQVDELFFEFLWGKGKRAKVKRDVVTNNKQLGGLKMIDFKKYDHLNKKQCGLKDGYVIMRQIYISQNGSTWHTPPCRSN